MTPRMAAKKDKQFLSSSTPTKPSPKIVKEKSKTTEKIVTTDKLPVGSIVWARVGTHPYWPSIITNEPDKDYHTKYMQHKYGVLRFSYHVNFFGDNGRRSWVLESHVFPFESRNDLEKKLRENSKSASRNTRDPNHFSAFWVNSSKKEKWDTAVSEAEGIISVPLIERVEKFCELLVEPVQETKDEKIGSKRKRKTDQNESNIEENVPKRIKLGRRKSTLKGVEIGSTLKNINEAPKVDTYEDDTPLLIRVLSTTSSDDKLNETNLKTSDLKQKTTKSTPVQEEIKEETKTKLADQKMNLEPLDPKDSKNTSDEMSTESEINKENKLTVSNTQSPLSTQSSVTSKQKKISLFKGIPKERVCQICLKPNKVFRCKGPCCGLFHISCDRNVKINPDDSEDSNLTTDSKDSIESGSSKSNSEFVKNFNFENLNLRKDYSSDSDTSRKSNITTLESQENLHNVKQDVNCNNKDDELPKPMKTVSLKEWEIFDAKLIEFIEKPGKNEDESTNENSEPDDDSSSYEPSISQTDSNGSNSHHKFKILKHVTADGVINAIIDETPRENNFKCTLCTKGLSPPCFICGRNVSKLGVEKRQKCILVQCGKFYHRECLKDWPQTKWSFKNYKVDDDNIEMVTCPHHNCHMCISDDPRGANSRLTNEKLTRCIRCPTTYHTSNYCIPAGTEILSPYQIICPKHYDLFRKSSKVKSLQHVNCTWCFICAMGGSLICCENCPASFHSECLKIKTPEGSFVCEECESGRLPLYNEIVWVKLGAYRWWPAQILYPNEVPENIRNIRHCAGEFVVRFFGSHDHYWVNRGRVFLFQDDDSGQISNKKNNVDELFLRAIGEAREMHKLVQDERDNQTAEWRIGMKPPHYVKIKSNRPVGTVRTIDANTSNTTPCDCDPNGENPCGPDSDCLNRILMTECNPLVCAAGERCCNQGFEKRQYAPVIPFRTGATGWGLKSLAAIRKGSFVIEYVGEIIEEKEYKRRIVRKHELKDENYYFLTIDKDRMIDAGPKGNVARFMNHSCSPNCETQKWTVNGDTRVGLFAIEDIPADAELTFNYNLECIGEEKKICKCGAKNCSGFIGVKAKQDDKRRTQERRMKKKKSIPEPEPVTVEINPCFVCGETGAVQPCSNKNCTKYYHLHCVQLESLQEGRWMCPWHSCNICAKRTSRSCFCCINSYCPNHSEGNIRYDETKFICRDHDTKRRLSRARKSKFIVDKRKKRYSAVSPKKILSENSASELTKVVDAEDVNEESVDSEIKLGKEEKVVNKDEGEEQSRMKNRKGRSRQSQRKVGEIKDETPPDKEVQEIEANDESTKENDKIDKVIKEDESSSKGKMEKEQNIVPEKRKGRRTKLNKSKNSIEIMEKDETEKLKEKKTTNEKPQLDDVSNTDLSNNSSTSKMDIDDEPLTKRLKRTRKERGLSKFKSSADIELETSSAPKSADVELEKNNTSERADVELEKPVPETVNVELEKPVPETVNVELEKRDDPETVDVELEKRNVPETVDVELEKRNVPETVDVELEKLAPETVGVQLEKSNTSFIEPLSKITEIQKQEKYTSSDSEIDSNIKFVKSKSRRRSSVKKSLSSEDEKSDNIEVLCSVKNIDVTITDEVSSEENDTNLRFVDDVSSEGDGIKRSRGRSKGVKHKKTPTRKSMRGVKEEPENITDKEDESKMNEKPLDEPLLPNRLSPKKKGRRRKEPQATVEKREEIIQPLPQINIKDTPVENIKKNTVQTEIKRQKGRPRKSVAPDLNNSQDKNRKEDSNVVDATNEIGTLEDNKSKLDSDVAKQTDQPIKSEEISKESKDNVQTAKKLVKKQTRKSLRKEQAISSEDTSTDEGIEIKTVNTEKKDSKESDSQDEDKGEGKEVLKPKKGRPKKKSGRKSEASNRIPVVEHVNKIILNEDEISLIKETKETDGSLSANKSDDVPPSFTNSSKANVPEDSSTEALILKEKKVIGNPTKDFPNAEEATVKKRERRNTEHNFKKRVLRSKVELGKDESLNVSLTPTMDVVIENVKETVPPVSENKDKTPASAPAVINQPSVSGDSPKKARKLKKRKHSDVDSLSENEVPKVAKEEAEGSSEGPRPDSTNLSDSSLTDSPKRKRGRPRKSDTKKNETETKSVYQERKMPYESAPVNEVKLTSIVPQRHLRVLLRKNSEIDSKNDSKFMKMQDDMERDLPIRKRSKLRYEAQL